MANSPDTSEVTTNRRVLTNFFGFNHPSYLDPSIGGSAFIFITKPSLFLYPQKPNRSNTNQTLAYENMCNDPIFSQFILSECKNENDKKIIKQLSYETFSDIPSYFMPIFTNLVRNDDLIDVTLANITAFNTRSGYFLNLPGKKVASEAASTLSLSLSETANSDVTKILTLWVNYINNIVNGTFNANPVMINNNIIDYMSSIYVFIVGMDGKTISNYCRYTGCYPTTIPLSASSVQKGNFSPVEINVSFNYSLFEANNPKILEDFNALSLKVIANDPNVSNAFYGDNEYMNFTSGGNNVDFQPIKSSNILNMDNLLSSNFASIARSSSRDPLVLVKTFGDNYSYQLSFGPDTYNNNETANTIGTDTSYSLINDYIK